MDDNGSIDNILIGGSNINSRRKRRMKRVGAAVLAGCAICNNIIASSIPKPYNVIFNDGDTASFSDHDDNDDDWLMPRGRRGGHHRRSLLADYAGPLSHDHGQSPASDAAVDDDIPMPRFSSIWPLFDYHLFKAGKRSMVDSSSSTSMMWEMHRNNFNDDAAANANAAHQLQYHDQQYQQQQQQQEEAQSAVKPYTAASAKYTNRHFGHTLMLIIFDPPTGNLLTYGDDSVGYNMHRGYSTSYILSRALLQNFPARFRPGGMPFQLLFTSADLPPVHRGCLSKAVDDYDRSCASRVEGFAPVITFGSAPKDASVLPSLHQFPLTNFMPCFERPHCKITLPIRGADALPRWKDLRPQIVWRGSDFHTARAMGYGHWMPGHSFRDVDPDVLSREEVVEGLMGHYGGLTPRWRAVVQSLKAKLDVEQHNGNGGVGNGEPWIDAMFLKNFVTTMYEEYDPMLERYEAHGIPVVVEEKMSEGETATYKYQLDIGGGSGTSWEGTLRKLAMPGLLFHHETPAKDFFYQEIQPWVHYVPVKMDLSDLRDKFEWAESHPIAAEAIARASTEYIRQNMATDAWIERTYDRYFGRELGSIVDAYRPLLEGETVASMVDDYRRTMAGTTRDRRLYSTCGVDGCTIAHHDGHFYKAFAGGGRQFVD